MSTGKIFGVIFLAIALMGGCTVAMEGNSLSGSDSPDELVSVTFDPAVQVLPDPVASGDYMAACYNMIGEMPGDVAYALELGWRFECLKSGDPMFTGKGDVQTLGYTDPWEQVVALDALSVSYNTIAHEAAHVVDIETLSEISRLTIAKKYREPVWDDAKQYWNFPSEMFAESRARCLGFEFDETFGEMSCSDIDLLIEQGIDGELVKEMQRDSIATEG